MSKNFLLEKRTKYLKIDDEKRRVIIFEAMIMNIPLKVICEKHKINFSSAKNVIQIFRKEGRLERKQNRVRKNRKQIESKNDSDLEEEHNLTD